MKRIEIGKFSPNKIELALLESIGLAAVKGDSSSGYYLEVEDDVELITETQRIFFGCNIYEKNIDRIAIKGITIASIEHGELKINMDGICQQLGPKLTSEELSQREEAYKKHVCTKSTNDFQKIQSDLKDMQQQMLNIQVLEGDHYASFQVAFHGHSTGGQILEKARKKIMDYFDSITNLLESTYDLKFEQLCDEKGDTKIEEECIQILSNAYLEQKPFNPNINLKVPVQVKDIVIRVIEQRIVELNKNCGFFKNIDLTERKVKALEIILILIKKEDLTTQGLQDLIKKASNRHDICQSRSRFSCFGGKTTTEKMLDEIYRTVKTAR